MFFKDFRWHLPKHLCVNGNSFQNAVSLESFGQPSKSPLSFRLVFSVEKHTTADQTSEEFQKEDRLSRSGKE